MADADPNGLDQHQPGAKLDADKIRPQLVLGGFSRALKEVVKVGTYGASKYTDNGWMHVENGIERYSEAAMRHWLEETQGIECDDESGLLHAAHFAWNALARLELILKNQHSEAVQSSLMGHPWEGPLTTWLAARGSEPFTSAEALVGAKLRETERINRADEMALAPILRRMGWGQIRIRSGGGRVRLWRLSLP